MNVEAQNLNDEALSFNDEARNLNDETPVVIGEAGGFAAVSSHLAHGAGK
jgi:hypothetical protein